MKLSLFDQNNTITIHNKIIDLKEIKNYVRICIYFGSNYENKVMAA